MNAGLQALRVKPDSCMVHKGSIDLIQEARQDFISRILNKASRVACGRHWGDTKSSGVAKPPTEKRGARKGC